MAKTFKCSLVTPQKLVLEEEVSYASIPAHDGQVGVMHQRAPLLVKLGVGALRLDDAQGKAKWFFVGGGFAQMKGNRLSLVAGEAVAAADVTQADADAAMKQSQTQQARTPEQVAQRDRQTARARTMTQLLGRK